MGLFRKTTEKKARTAGVKRVDSPADSPAVQQEFEKWKALSEEERQKFMKDKDRRSRELCWWAGASLDD